MIARLWWKETRTLWPAWPVLFGAGVLLQWVLLASGAEGIRSGLLMLIALCWATIYAFVTASAAFAGERETNTLGLLDALPVNRRMLWLGKTTFALASTLGLALIMLALGYLGSTNGGDLPGKADFIGHYGTLLFEAVAWGLLWSALLRNPMVAGALALFCVGEVSYIASGGAKVEFISDSVIPARLLMATLALAASAVAIVWRPLAGWSPWFLKEDAANTPAGRARPIRLRPASSTKALAWKAKREGFWMWLGASAAVWAALAFLFAASRVGDVDVLPITLFSVCVLAALVTGVGVFGGETATESQRFLLHLGVGPGPIWSRTMRAWGNGLAATALIMLVMFSVCRPHEWQKLGLLWFTPSHTFQPVLIAIAPIANAFAVGTLAGMVFRRRITAGMIAVVVWLAIVPLQSGLAILGMVPHWTLLLTPIALLIISRAWAGDWLDARPGPARWLRLAGYAVAPSVVFSAAFIANRAWGVPDPGPVMVAASAPSGIVPPGSDKTATTYHRLAMEILPMYGIAATEVGAKVQGGRPPDISRLRVELNKNQDFIKRIQQATEMPPPQLPYRPLFGGGSDPDPTSGDISRVAWLLDQHGRGCLEQDNLTGAWEDILAQYRMARQMTEAGPTSFVTQNALAIDRQATMLALDWAAGDKQTPDLLRKALTDLRALPPFPTLGDVMKAEAPLVERALDLSGAELEVAINGPRTRPIPTRIYETMLLYPSWERERARRVCRAEFKRLIAASASESEPSPSITTFREAENRQRNSPLAARVLSYTWFSEHLKLAMVGRRGLVQVIALRAWNQTHDGTYPETLDALVPDLLDRLPLDPYSAQPFGYLRSRGERVPRLNLQFMRRGDLYAVRPGQWLLFSVGPKLGVVDPIAVAAPELQRISVDSLVFPLP
ncbi:ABC transporter permease [Singulisphaera acidiphila]|uniref:ABC-type transport system involved in multi-copper enzyme maturation, permease component n=1 Tax=Singulisphaera acidiphila (strain ATCC BAA-1392 / DSM 18658 / VKM B-2454 / MOB10) TaxID=886293 RepID=L0DEB4_SINAD|nr:hypothetical protein [Singulisphaera acidiphila]AGA27592.1 hypothetical protein Sinac_3325 [Singulisphaera acidiphila DSM 18658]